MNNVVPPDDPAFKAKDAVTAYDAEMDAEAQLLLTEENDWDAQDAEVATFDCVNNVKDDVNVNDAVSANKEYEEESDWDAQDDDIDVLEFIDHEEVTLYVPGVKNDAVLALSAKTAYDAVSEKVDVIAYDDVSAKVDDRA